MMTNANDDDIAVSNKTAMTPTDLNATRADLEKLNGLLIRALIAKLEKNEATATDIGNAVKVVTSNRVQPVEPEGPHVFSGTPAYAALDFPVDVDALDDR
ncbi:hypothetical protein [Citreimonas salinaria]|uniref:Uncharacterized protein n=1 Tax=Citreimonas salinaria TaxID=321339 RepID=A0A1H3LNU4_9RHOB|nr:hypothetical protein [Citreimonas salinaria]SDY65515.1 hypothetical protein SAMN05444340_11398 [Citreimonas salinaria]